MRLSLVSRQTPGPRVTSTSLPVPFTHTNCRLGLHSQPPDKNGQGSGKAQTLNDPRPQGLDDGQSGPLSWWPAGHPQVSCLSFENGATKSPSYLANPKLRKKEIVIEREAKGSQNKQVCPWISGFLRGFHNWHGVQPGAAHCLVSSGEEQEARFLGIRLRTSSVQGAGLSLLSPKSVQGPASSKDSMNFSWLTGQLTQMHISKLLEHI